MATGHARDLSVVLYGASGFTGRLVAHYLAARGGTGRIGLAGRCRQKLEAVAAETARVGWEPDVLVAEADDHAALSALAARTRVVLSTAGPYALCGTPLVAACLAAGTDYVDINGEVPWMRSLVDRFDAEAARADVRIVPSCGYSVPSDLGTLATVQAMQRRFGEDVRSVQSFMHFNGRLSGGTMATGILLDEATDAVQAERRDPFLLGGAPPGGARPEDADPSGASYEATLDAWCAPFWMSAIDSRVVRRSHQLFREAQLTATGEAATGEAGGRGYGRGFGFRERALARDEAVARGLAAPMAEVERRKRLIARGKLPAPGQGPSAEVRARSWFRLFLLGEAESGRYAFASPNLTQTNPNPSPSPSPSPKPNQAPPHLGLRRRSRLRRHEQDRRRGGAATRPPPRRAPSPQPPGRGRPRRRADAGLRPRHAAARGAHGARRARGE